MHGGTDHKFNECTINHLRYQIWKQKKKLKYENDSRTLDE